MANADFYRVLGVDRSATSDEIRSAYRALVKKYHPDLFSEPGEKAVASERLRLINEAYTVLGAADRRRQYDQELAQNAQPARPASGVRVRSRFSRSPRRAKKQQTASRKRHARKRFSISRKWMGYSLAAAAAALTLFFTTRSEPRLVTSWLLMEKLEVSPALDHSKTHPSGDGWARVGEFGSVSECVAILKQKVRQDEQEGSRAVYDEQRGTMAITVLVRQAGQKPDSSPASGLLPEQAPAAKRTRTLECRPMQQLKMDSWFRRALKRFGGAQ